MTVDADEHGMPQDLGGHLFDLSPVAIMVVDRNGRIVMANAEAERTLGITREEMMRRTYDDPAWHITGYEGDRFHDEALPVQQVLQKREAVYGIEYAVEKPGGERIYLSVNAAPVWTDEGEISHIVCMVRDVTAQHVADAALLEREQRFRALFEQSLDAIWIVALDGTILEVNQAWLDMFGFRREEVGSLNAADFYVDPDGRRQFLESIASQGFVRDVVRFRRKDGTVLDCERRVVSLRDKTGAVVGFQGVVRDVTEQKRLAQALQESEEHYRTVFEQSMDALYVVDVEGRSIRANKRWLDMFGYTSEELPFLSAADVYVDPAERSDFLQRVSRDGYVEDDVLFKRKDGTVFTCHRLVVPLRNSTGAVVAFHGVFRDVTEQRRLEEALRDREEKYRSLFEQAREAITIVTPEGVILDANQAWFNLFGYTRDDLSSLNMIDVYANPGDRKKFLRRMAQDGFVEDEVWYRKRDGTPVLCDRSVSARKNEYGVTVAFQAFERDITEERRLQRELHSQADRLRLLAQRVQAAREEERTGIARELHDSIGQRLTAVRLDLHRLKEALRGGRSGCIDAVEQIERLLDDTVDDVRRISSELRPGVLDEIGLVGAIDWQICELKKRTDISYAVDLPEEVPLLDEGRKTALFRVFQELMANVVRHSGATSVRVSLEQHGNVVCMTVADDGCGLAPQQIEAPSPLGVVGMRERLQPFGGILQYESAPGAGTTARVTMPVS